MDGNTPFFLLSVLRTAVLSAAPEELRGLRVSELVWTDMKVCVFHELGQKLLKMLSVWIDQHIYLTIVRTFISNQIQTIKN